jgi:hypothetical protein
MVAPLSIVTSNSTRSAAWAERPNEVMRASVRADFLSMVSPESEVEKSLERLTEKGLIGVISR